MKIKLNKGYLLAFILVFILEALIALYVDDHFIRPYLGDVLVVVLIYCFIRSFIAGAKRLPLYIFIFALSIELGQRFNVARLLGLQDSKFANLILGSTFDIKDIACYFTGCMGLLLFEAAKRQASLKTK